MKKFHLVIDSIYEAGRMLMKDVGKEKNFSMKERQHYLTDYDVKIDNLIVAAIKKTFPNDNINSEEGGVIKGNNDYTWYIDPLSNTRNYIHGLHGFAISVGRAKKDKPVLGFVYDPWLEDFFSAEVGKGARLNGKIIKTSQFSFGEHAFINVDWQKRKGMKEIQEGVALFAKIGTHCTVRAMGSVALTACYVACGRMEAMLNNYSDFHALMPASIIVREAGGDVLNLDGRPWNLKSRSTFVTNHIVTDGIILCLKR